MVPSVPVINVWVEFLAVTVKVDSFPAMIEVGLAVIPVAGAGFGVTEMMVLAEDFPPPPVAIAVYVVVIVGLTACIPPLDNKE